MIKNTVLPLLIMAVVFSTACNSPSDETAKDVNPFEKSGTVADSLTATERKQLIGSRGKSATVVGYEGIVERFDATTNKLELFLFFDATDEATTEMLERACHIESVLPVNKLTTNLSAIYTGPIENLPEINLLIREKNLFYDVLVIDDAAWPLLYNDLKTQWNGKMPAVMAVYQKQQSIHWFNHLPSVAELEMLFQ